MIHNIQKLASCVFCLFFFLTFPSNSGAHQSQTNYIVVTVKPDTLLLTFKFDITDLERVFALDTNNDGTVQREELLAKMPEMFAKIEASCVVRLDYLSPDLQRQEGGFEKDQLGNLFILFPFKAVGIGAPGALTIGVDYFEDFGPRFRTLGRANFDDKIEQFILSDFSDSATLELDADGVNPFKQIYAYIVQGIWHIFEGPDHIMFLLGLLLLGGRFVDLIKIVTSFTVSHSVTLVLASLNIIILPVWLVESAIALSVVYIAVENFYVEGVEKRWLVTGSFGFIHGFGFANVLGDLGLPTNYQVPTLFAFNLGVEIGQVAIVAVILPIVWLVAKTKYHKYLIWAGSAIILIFGATWFLERAFGLPVSLM